MIKVLSRIAAVAALATAALTVAPQSASALPLKLQYDGAWKPFQNVSYNRVDPSKSSLPLGPGLSQPAGAFKFTDISPAPSLGTFAAWCFDIDFSISPGGQYFYNVSTTLLNNDPPYFNLNSGAASNAVDRVQKLFDANYDISTVLATSENSTAFQLAIWEVLYDDNFSLAPNLGNFWGDSTVAIANKAQGYLTAAFNYGGGKNWVITTYDSDGAQDIGTATAIPLPAAVWLLLGVAGALVAGKRYSARKLA